MGAHRSDRRFPFSVENGRHDALMLGVRFGEAPECAELRAAEGRDTRTCLGGQPLKVGVVRAGIDRSMKTLVGLVVALGIAAAHDGPQCAMDALQLRALRLRHALCCKAGAKPLQLTQRLEHAHDLALVRARNDGAPVWPRLYEATRHEQANGLAHRRS